MTIRTIVWILVLCGLAWVGAMAFVSRDKRIKHLAQAHSLSAEETQALRVCLRGHAVASTRRTTSGARAESAAVEAACVCESVASLSAVEPRDVEITLERTQRAALRDDCAGHSSPTARLRAEQAPDNRRT